MSQTVVVDLLLENVGGSMMARSKISGPDVFDHAIVEMSTRTVRRVNALAINFMLILSMLLGSVMLVLMLLRHLVTR